jgi:hypothetical protein
VTDHRPMRECETCLPMSDLRLHKSYAVKTEDDTNSGVAEVSDSANHVIKMENDIDSNLADVSHQVIKMEDGDDPNLADESEHIIKMEKRH